jgi:hypothetical protein
MDDHAARVTEPVLRALDAYERDQASVADVQAAVGGAADALDNSHADIIAVLRETDADLEVVQYATPLTEQGDAMRRLATVLRDALPRA